MPTIYRDDDADLDYLKGKTIGVIGYGNQGRAQAMNLKDSGVSVIVGNIDDSYREQAILDGQEVLDIAAASQRADILMILLPDEVQPEIYDAFIGPHLKPGMTHCRRGFLRSEGEAYTLSLRIAPDRSNCRYCSFTSNSNCPGPLALFGWPKSQGCENIRCSRRPSYGYCISLERNMLCFGDNHSDGATRNSIPNHRAEIAHGRHSRPRNWRL